MYACGLQCKIECGDTTPTASEPTYIRLATDLSMPLHCSAHNSYGSGVWGVALQWDYNDTTPTRLVIAAESADHVLAYM